MAEEIVKIRSAPGIKRDGTRLDGDNYVDGKWVRFQRGLPRKMGGYRSISKYLRGVVRSLHEYTQDLVTYIHAGSATNLERFFIDGSYNTSVIYDRTPAALAPSASNMWQFDVETSASATGLQLVAQVAPNLSCICNSAGGQLFYGDLLGTAPLTEVTALPAGASLTGGVVALHPFTVAFGNDGFVMWSPDCADFTVSGAGYAYVTGQKIVRGMAMRGGPGSSPSGLLWSADSVIRMTYTGGTAGFTFDTISTQSSILSSQGVIEYDGIFFWPGVDRFLMFNGVVREIENNLNLNFFYDNLNQAQRQKVFAYKVPRFGEIWWCFPTGDSTEPNHAVIYNVRENTWYDTPLPDDKRSAGLFPAVFSKPLMASPEPTYLSGARRVTEQYSASAEGEASLRANFTAGTYSTYAVNDEGVRITEAEENVRVTEETGQARYKFWVHEVGTDRIDGIDIQPIRSFFETAEISLPVQTGQNKALQVALVEPDFVQSGPLTVSVHGRANARAPEVNSDPQTISETASTPQEQVVFFKTQRRELRFRFESNAVGGDYQMGLVLAHVQPGDGTVLG